MKSIAFKKAVLMTYLLSCLLFFSLPVSAHSGGTDSAGGHWNRTTGEYHFHHGYPAHQHEDTTGDGVPDCPYGVGNEAKSSNSQTGTSSYSYKDLQAKYDSGYDSGYDDGFDDGYKRSENENKEKISQAVLAAEKKTRESAYLISIFLIVPFAVILTVYFANSLHQKELSKKDEEINQAKIKLNKAISLLSLGKDALLNVPDDVALTYECKPILGQPSGIRPFGGYTVFTSAGGKKYHCTYGCCGATLQVHLFSARRTHEPCKNCVPIAQAKAAIPDWYIIYESSTKKVYK